MQAADINQVDVINASAWKRAISKMGVSGQSRHEFDLLGAGTPLVQFTVRFAVLAQDKIREGESFADFATGLAEEVMQEVGEVSRSGVNWMIELLKAHWSNEYSKGIGSWKY